MLKVNDLYPCIQGEGGLTGTAMVLLRLQGCDVGCPFCDTKETWHKAMKDRETRFRSALGTGPAWAEIDEQDLAGEVMRVAGPIRWVMVTGGEPCLQDLDRLTKVLRKQGYSLCLETSGTEEITGLWDWITVSPKFQMPKGKRLHAASIMQAHEVKQVIGKPDDLDIVNHMISQGWTSAPKVSLQPMSESKAATEFCMRTCLARGFRLSLQTHKWIGAR